MQDPCIFCQVNEANLIYRDSDGIVILDDPIREGHVLVGATRHAQSLHDLKPDEAAGVLRLACRAASLIVNAVGATKVYVAAVGDKDKHFHVHLLPKAEGDPNLGPYIFGGNGWASFLPSTVDTSAVARVTETLRTRLSA